MSVEEIKNQRKMLVEADKTNVSSSLPSKSCGKNQLWLSVIY